MNLIKLENGIEINTNAVQSVKEKIYYTYKIQDGELDEFLKSLYRGKDRLIQRVKDIEKKTNSSWFVKSYNKTISEIEVRIQNISSFHIKPLEKMKSKKYVYTMKLEILPNSALKGFLMTRTNYPFQPKLTLLEENMFYVIKLADGSIYETKINIKKQ